MFQQIYGWDTEHYGISDCHGGRAVCSTGEGLREIYKILYRPDTDPSPRDTGFEPDRYERNVQGYIQKQRI